MRKFLWMVAVGALVLAVAAPAMALDFKFSSANRFRIMSVDGIGAETTTVTTSPFAKSTTNQRNQGDARFRPYFIVSDDNNNVQSHLRLEIGDVVFGDTSVASPGGSSGGKVGADGVNVETKSAFIDIALPFGIPARLRGGIQPYFLPKGLLVDDDGSGIRLYGEVKPFKYDFWWLAANERQNAGTQTVGSLTVGPANDDIDFYAARIDMPVAPALNPYVYGVFRHGTSVTTNQGSDSSEGGWFGAGSVGAFGIVKYDVDFVIGSDGPYFADAVDERRGWVLDGGVEAPVGPAALGLRAMYATGDKDTTVTKSEDFPALRRGDGSTMSSYTVSGNSQLFWDSAGSGLFQGGYTGTPANTWTLGGYVSYNPVKALNLKLDYFYIGAPKKATNFFTGKSRIAQEIALVATYQLWTGTKAVAIAGWLIPPGTGGDTAGTELKTAQAFSFVVQHDF